MPDNEQLSSLLQEKLAEVEDQISKLVTKRNAYKELLGQSVDPSDPLVASSGPAAPPLDKTVQSDSFHRMRVGNAAIKFLGMVGRPPRSVPDILKALNFGGLTVKYPVLYKTLTRLQGKKLEKGGDTWGLLEWYDKDRSKSPAKPKTATAKVAKKAAKVALVKEEKAE